MLKGSREMDINGDLSCKDAFIIKDYLSRQEN